MKNKKQTSKGITLIALVIPAIMGFKSNLFYIKKYFLITSEKSEYFFVQILDFFKDMYII